MLGDESRARFSILGEPENSGTRRRLLYQVMTSISELIGYK